MPDLKPCPFCGGTSIYTERVVAYTMTGCLYKVRCGNIPYCGVTQSGFYTEAEAIEAWNRRIGEEDKNGPD